MNILKTEHPERYTGLYVIDFGDHCGLGYTAEETAILLESQEYADAKVYKVHRARPDGSMDLAGVAREKFLSESGMFFHCFDEMGGRDGFQTMQNWAGKQAPPCRAKLHLAKDRNGTILLGLIYPAEVEHEMGQWLAASGFCGSGPVDAGVSQVERYYAEGFEILDKCQFWPAESLRSRDREEVFATVGVALQR